MFNKRTKKTLYASVIGILCMSMLPGLAFAWSMEKPNHNQKLNERIYTAKLSTDGHAGVGQGIHIFDFEKAPSIYGPDCASVQIVATANTREGLDYYSTDYTDFYEWIELTDYATVSGTGDDWIQWKDLNTIPGPGLAGFPRARFYGAYGSRDFDKIGVSSNGFVTFNDTTTADPYYSRPIPDTEDPDDFAAPFWTDLKPTLGGSIKIGFDVHPSLTEDILVVTWDEVPGKYGTPQTFQVIILEPFTFHSSVIIFQYKDVTVDDDVTIGIESGFGSKGNQIDPASIDVNPDDDDSTAIFFNTNDLEFAFISRIKIEIDIVANSGINILENAGTDYDMVRGVNVQLRADEPNTELWFVGSLSADVVLLLAGLLLPGGPAAGFFLGLAGIGLTAVEYLAENMPKAEATIVDGQDPSYAEVPVKGGSPHWPTTYVDANLGISLIWLMPTQTQTSTIKVSSTLEYFTVDYYGSSVTYKTVTTDQVTLSFTYTTNCCVEEGTLITMADGATKPIEDIKKGDQVLGFWPNNGSYMVENVLDVIKGQFEVMVNINNGMLKITPLDHPIYYRNSTYEGWMQDPANIQVGWEIYNATSNGWVPVSSVTFEEGKTKGYDLVLDGYETYIANGILVLDKNGDGC